MVWQLTALAVPTEDLGSVLRPPWGLTTIFPVSGDLIPSSDLPGHHAHMCCIYIHADKIYINKK